MKTRDKRRKLMRLNKVCVYSILWYTVSWSTTWSHCLSSVSHTISVIHFGGSFHLLFGSASAAQVITMIQMNEWMNEWSDSQFVQQFDQNCSLSVLPLSQANKMSKMMMTTATLMQTNYERFWQQMQQQLRLSHPEKKNKNKILGTTLTLSNIMQPCNGRTHTSPLHIRSKKEKTVQRIEHLSLFFFLSKVLSGHGILIPLERRTLFTLNSLIPNLITLQRWICAWSRK